MTSDLAGERVTALLRGAFGRPYRFESSCASTQDLMREPGLPEGAVAAADHQTAGRGRSGRTWEALPGDSLLFSVLLLPQPGPELPQLSLVVALAVAQAVEGATSVTAGVKWPNDVELGGRKVAGILVEASGPIVVCGVGVNVNQTEARLPAETRRPAGSLLLATGRRHDRGELLASVLERLEEHYRMWSRERLEPLLPELRARSTLTGRRVLVGGVAGVAGEIATDGRLAVRFDDGGLQLVSSGELELGE